jgi:hypothetical protein
MTGRRWDLFDLLAIHRQNSAARFRYGGVAALELRPHGF